MVHLRFWLSPSPQFLCGISHTLSRPANFIYLFVHERDLLVTWFLSVSQEDWVPVFSVYTADCAVAIFLLSCWVFEW